MAKKANYIVRRWVKDDIDELVKLHATVYTDYKAEDLYDYRTFNLQFSKFPEGQFLVESENEIVGYASSIIVQLQDDQAYYTYSEMTGSGSFSTHNPFGDTLYGADIAVHPEHRRQGVAILLYKERDKLLKKFNLRRMVAHGRIAGYREYTGKYTAEEYVNLVIKGEVFDSALKAHLKAGYHVKNVLLDHASDFSSMDYATWLEKINPKFSDAKRKIEVNAIRRPIRKIRVCAAQYEFRNIKDWEEFEDSMEFFLDSAHTYHSHLLVFPELFTAQLFSTFPADTTDISSIEMLACYEERLLEYLVEQAKKYDLYIVAGSTPVKRETKIFNRSFLISPRGKIYWQDKLHITPAERRYWGITPGEAIKVFDTPMGRIGILVCYDIEFPELTRILVKHGIEILICPFSTDGRKAYNRVRFCAHARAVENYIYVVIAGNVGNLHNVKSYLLNYGQSAILTPSDFAFPGMAVEAEADPNNETCVVADLDINNLLIQREIGSVRPLYDMRNDLYEVKHKIPVEIVKVE